MYVHFNVRKSFITSEIGIDFSFNLSVMIIIWFEITIFCKICFKYRLWN